MFENRHYYTDERNAQILLALLKAHGIHRIIANPGTTNIAIVGSVQNDPYFQVWSAVDERHAAYMACGMAAESGEPVVLSCTGATASRNYLPAMTEAYYRKLPLLVVTSSQPDSHRGHLWAQMIDRRSPPNDTIRYSTQINIVNSEDDAKICELEINTAISELWRGGGGPVHINLVSSCARFNTTTLPDVKLVQRVHAWEETWPSIRQGSRIAIWIGSHKRFTRKELAALEAFVKSHDAVVLMDHTSGYVGYGCVNSALACFQGLKAKTAYSELKPDLIIHIGEVTGDYYSVGFLRGAAPVWRVSEDGEMRDLFQRLEAVFEMPESMFFLRYAGEACPTHGFMEAWQRIDAEARKSIPDLPFSNIWIQSQLRKFLPAGSEFHMGILNSLRAGNFHQSSPDVEEWSNVGGFGIDGDVSTAIGASLCNSKRLYFCVVGDLAFFYDLNSLGNRHIGNNLRVLLVNNGTGAEFSLYNHLGNIVFGAENRRFIGAAGHFHDKSSDLVRHYATDLGFKYLCAKSKEELLRVLPEFVAKEMDKSILLECFTTPEAESDALKSFGNLIECHRTTTDAIKKLVPDGMKQLLRKVVQ